MSITVTETIEHEFRTIKDTSGAEYSLDSILQGPAARIAQVYPGFCVLYLSPIGSKVKNTTAATIREEMLLPLLRGEVTFKLHDDCFKYFQS